MRRLVLLLAVAGAALAVGAVDAYFTARAQVPDNVVRAGTVALSAEPTSAALSLDALAPGATSTKVVNVANDGDLPVSMVMTVVKKAGITDLWNALTCRVSVDGASLYEGGLAAMRTAPLTVPAGARVPVRFAIGLPAEADGDLAGDYARFTLYLDAEQLR